jgi:hypothetical protein
MQSDVFAQRTPENVTTEIILGYSGEFYLCFESRSETKKRRKKRE